MSGYAEIDHSVLAKNTLISFTDQTALNWNQARCNIVLLITFTEFSVRHFGGIESRINKDKNLVIANR